MKPETMSQLDTIVGNIGSIKTSTPEEAEFKLEALDFIQNLIRGYIKGLLNDDNVYKWLEAYKKELMKGL